MRIIDDWSDDLKQTILSELLADKELVSKHEKRQQEEQEMIAAARLVAEARNGNASVSGVSARKLI